MLNVKLITIGTLKESYLREAAEEYKKRLGAYCKFTEVNLSEVKLSDKPSAKEIEAALDDSNVGRFAKYLHKRHAKYVRDQTGEI